MKLVLVAVVVCAVLAAACGEAKNEAPPRPTATPTVAVQPTATGGDAVVDMVGRVVVIPESVERVVAISPSAVDYAVALGLEVVGRSSDATNPEAADAAEVGSSLSPDFNLIAELEPDLVIADAAFHSGSLRDFEQFPYPSYMIEVRKYEDVGAVFTALGEALGIEETADEAAADVEAQVQEAAEGAELGADAVLVLAGSGRDVTAASADTYIGSLLELLGVENVFGTTAEGAPLPGFGVVDIEQQGSTLQSTAEAVLILPAGPGDSIASQIAALPGWAISPAVQDGLVVELDIDLFLRAPGPRAGEAIEALVEALRQ